LIISSSVYPLVIISHQQQNEKMLLFFRQALAQSQEQRQNSSSGRVDTPLTNVVAKQTNNIVGLHAYYDISFRIGTTAAIKSIKMQFPADTNVSIPGAIGTDGTLIGPAPAQDTMRMNGADATYITGSIVELTAAGQTPK
jgi:hypothetical protein